MKTNFIPEEIDFDKSGNGLVPAVVQDDTTLKVLMLGYMDKEALQKTLEQGRVTFFSRTRGKLWTKGETSGNYLKAVGILTDCDKDTLLVRAVPAGPVCHTGTLSCFPTEDSEGFIRSLSRIIRTRKEERPESSYTVRLLDEGIRRIAQKVGEEAVETVIEAVGGNRERLVYEISDLIYHLLVLLEHQEIPLETIEKELLGRHA